MECARVDGSWLMYGKTASVEEGTDLGMVMMTVWCRAICSTFPRYLCGKTRSTPRITR
jgi:hypothetical protein